MEKTEEVQNTSGEGSGARLNYAVEMDLLLASDCGDLELVKELVQLGANVNEKFQNDKFNLKYFLPLLISSCTPLHYATRSGHLHVVEFLLQSGADVNAVEKENWTALYYAANNGHLKIAQLLLEHGADKTIKDNFKGRTCLSVAEYRQFHEMVKLLGGSNRNYLRQEEAIAKRGAKKKVLKGIHWNYRDLFLGKYRIFREEVEKISKFRKSNADDIHIEGEDTVLGIPVTIRHSHHFEEHEKETLSYFESGKRFLRSSTISTNEHILVTPR